VPNAGSESKRIAAWRGGGKRVERGLTIPSFGPIRAIHAQSGVYGSPRTHEELVIAAMGG